jgi:5-deoxy-D-glucuronate isomerase
MGTQLHPAIEKMVFRNTNRHLGRHISVTPGNSTNRHLSYGRIILNRSTPSVSFSNGNHETGLICLSGSGTVQKDSTLKFTTGRPGSVRQVSICLGKNIEAGRLLLGFTISDPGNWTSWPPHEHAEMLEEMYVYFDMPRPAYGIQLVYNDTESPRPAPRRAGRRCHPDPARISPERFPAWASHHVSLGHGCAPREEPESSSS